MTVKNFRFTSAGDESRGSEFLSVQARRADWDRADVATLKRSAAAELDCPQAGPGRPPCLSIRVLRTNLVVVLAPGLDDGHGLAA